MMFMQRLVTRAVDPEPDPKQFWITEAGAKNFQMVEPEPEIWIPVQACYTNNMFFSIFRIKLFWIRSQNAQNVGARAKNLNARS